MPCNMSMVTSVPRENSFKQFGIGHFNVLRIGDEKYVNIGAKITNKTHVREEGEDKHKKKKKKKKDTCEEVETAVNSNGISVEMYRKEIKKLGAKYVGPKLNEQMTSLFTQHPVTCKNEVLHKHVVAENIIEGGEKQINHLEKRSTRCRGPSHYKRRSKGTYSASYDPLVTLQNSKAASCSPSFYGCNDEKKNLTSRIFQTSSVTGEESEATKRDVFESDVKNVNDRGSSTKSHSCLEAAGTSGNNFKQETDVFHLKYSFPKTFNDRLNETESRSGVHETRANSLDNYNKNTSRDMRISRANSSFVGVSEEYLSKLQKRYDAARKMCRKKNTTPTPSVGKTTAVHDAVKTNNIEALRKLILDGFDLNLPDERGYPAFHYALVERKVECLAVLLTGGANIAAYFQMRKFNSFK